ncbi:MAG: S24/S26 family peptidase [Clostridia bacterium]|nr:S24/S26 family peptidase [Clostridia bacterium]
MNNKRLTSIDEMIPLIEERIKNGGSVSFTPMGISMYPMLRHGIDNVVLSPAPEKLKKYDIPFYRRKNGRYVLHRVVKVTESYTCIGDNEYRYEQGIEHSQVIAVVTSFTRKGKEYSTENLGYKIYCRVWHYSRFPRRVLRAVKRVLRNIIKGKQK